jgi:hypothetical protein
MHAEIGPGPAAGTPPATEPASPLRQCPRCGGWCVDPADEDGHLLGTAGRWRGYGPLPRLRYCTPTGRETRPLPPPPDEPYQRWEWTAGGYRPVLHVVEGQEGAD